MDAVKKAAKGLIAKFGFQTDRRIVVFESDDWGAIRVPDNDALLAFKERFPLIELDHYQSYDGLETVSDVHDLSSLLLSYSETFDLTSPVFTLNFATANPNFQKCVSRDRGCAHFEFEAADVTYRTYDGNNEVLNFVRAGRDKTALHPQLHGREHLNATSWLNHAFEDPAVDFARELCMVGVDSAFYKGIDALNNSNTLVDAGEYIGDGVALFERFFGFRPKSFIPPCYVADKERERIAAGFGINTIQSSLMRNIPKGADAYSRRINIFGRSGFSGLCRLTRNVQFEPSRSMFQSRNIDECVNSAIVEIEAAFSRRQPAVICTHRVNYTSRVDDAHREYSLEALSALLQRLASRYPDCEFMTSDQLGEVILSQ